MNELAFPLVGGDDIGIHAGLTKREYFAALLMNGYLSTYNHEYEPSAEDAALKAVRFADALIVELDKPVSNLNRYGVDEAYEQAVFNQDQV